MVKSLKTLSGEPTSRTFQEFWLRRMTDEVSATVGAGKVRSSSKKKKKAHTPKSKPKAKKPKSKK